MEQLLIHQSFKAGAGRMISDVAVFVDGCFWHGCPDHGTQPRTNSTYWAAKLGVNRARDREQTAALKQAGWTVVRVWEHEDAHAAAARVRSALRVHAACPSQLRSPPRVRQRP